MGPLHITKVEEEREKGSNESGLFPYTPDNNNARKWLSKETCPHIVIIF